MTEPAAGVRLQKVLAAAGIASRRACEILISEGRVEVNSGWSLSRAEGSTRNAMSSESTAPASRRRAGIDTWR